MVSSHVANLFHDLYSLYCIPCRINVPATFTHQRNFSGQLVLQYPEADRYACDNMNELEELRTNAFAVSSPGSMCLRPSIGKGCRVL